MTRAEGRLKPRSGQGEPGKEHRDDEQEQGWDVHLEVSASRLTQGEESEVVHVLDQVVVLWVGETGWTGQPHRLTPGWGGRALGHKAMPSAPASLQPAHAAQMSPVVRRRAVSKMPTSEGRPRRAKTSDQDRMGMTTWHTVGARCTFVK